MRTIAVCNQKGGVGKTVSTYHLAWALAHAGHRVLVVDADPQGNLTGSLAAETLPDDTAGLADVLAAGVPLAEVLVPTMADAVTLVPTTGDALAVARDRLFMEVVGREYHLFNALYQIAADYDYCLIDCPPSLDLLTINALAAANSVIVVTHAKKYSADGLARLVGTIERVREAANSGLMIEGILINQSEAATQSGALWATELAEYAARTGTHLFSTMIPKRVKISDSAEMGRSLADLGHPELSALFDALVKEITQ